MENIKSNRRPSPWTSVNPKNSNVFIITATMRFNNAGRLLLLEHNVIVANKNIWLNNIRFPPAKPRPWSIMYKRAIR